MNTRRTFFKTVMLALPCIALFPFNLEPSFPDEENGLKLRKVYRNGKRVRMKDIRKGDILEVELNCDGKYTKFHAEENPTFANKTWGLIVKSV